MDKSNLRVGNIYTQVRSGHHKGSKVRVLAVGPNFVSYKPVGNNGYNNIMQRVSVDRFCLMFE